MSPVLQLTAVHEKLVQISLRVYNDPGTGRVVMVAPDVGTRILFDAALPTGVSQELYITQHLVDL